ncbi:SulP family inorganic anion transporter [Cellulosimicrobium cellulans]|uniref:SulP family inorganic anion transporter n=1 Tax=Cellulosimicrobium cellulans TaxID=1710 RepID=UPI0027DDE5A5|nr:SulP family inorganic anion transporter [Cellulosimicrobium cellulans]
MGLGSVALLLLLGRTRVAPNAAVVALVVSSVGVWALGATSVQLVGDAGEIPAGLPSFALPDLGLVSVDVAVGALAVAAIVLVQGAGVAESVPNPGGRRADPNRNFVGQGVANLAAGFFRGIPVGGSVGQTAISTAAWARDRWAGIMSGVWVLVVLVALSGPVGAVPSATLAALLAVASVGSMRLSAMATAWRTGSQSQVAMATTFLATLLLPVAAAVGIGAALSILLQANRESQDLRIVRLVPLEDGTTARSRHRGTSTTRPSPCSTSTGACSTPARARSRPRCRNPGTRTTPSSCCVCEAARASARPRSLCSRTTRTGSASAAAGST